MVYRIYSVECVKSWKYRGINHEKIRACHLDCPHLFFEGRIPGYNCRINQMRAKEGLYAQGSI